MKRVARWLAKLPLRVVLLVVSSPVWVLVGLILGAMWLGEQIERLWCWAWEP